MDEITIERSIWIAASLERVWQAITDPAEITQWFSPESPWELSALEVGGELNWHSGEDHIDRHVILRVEAPQIFAYRWEPEPPDKPRTSTYLLQEEDGGTRLTIQESGFELLDEDDRKPQMDGAAKGYKRALEGLKAYIEADHV
jgi:uncharacterized protein YndB with AHSA1/START domain